MILLTVSLPWARYFTKSTRPPFALKTSLRTWVLTLVGEGDLDAFAQERELAQSLGDRLEPELEGLDEDLGVGPELHARARLGGRLAFRELAQGLAALVGLAPREPVARDLDLEPRRQGVDDGDADAVQPAGDLVAATAELAAGVEHREHDLDGRPAVLRPRDRLDGDAAPVVVDAHRAVGVDRDEDLVGEAGHGLVDRVVHDLVHQVVEPAGARGPDVHARTFADRLQSLQHLDVAGVIACCGLLGRQRASDRARAAASRSDAGGRAREGRTNPLSLPHGRDARPERGAEKRCSSWGFAPRS